MTDHKDTLCSKSTIFIVDDDPASQELLNDIIVRQGHDTRCFSGGTSAILAALAKPPDVILLDVMMPGINGFEVCRQLKQNDLTKYIPVIMVTCLNEQPMRLKGIEVGADDFISKPIDTTEIMLRVRNLLMVKRYHDFIRQHSEILEEQVKQRTEELENALEKLTSAQQHLIQQEKMAAIGQLTAGVAHEINNPIGFIASNVSSLGRYCEKLVQFIGTQQDLILSLQLPPDSTTHLQATYDQMKIKRVINDIPEMIAETEDGVERIKSIVKDLKCFSRVDESLLTLTDINRCLESTLNIVHNELKYKATLSREYGDIPQILCYPQQLNQVFMNLLVNAGHAIAEHGEIGIRTTHNGDSIFVSISDTGCGIPEETKKHIFEPFFTTKEYGKGTGLGLSISTEIIRKHGGDIKVASEVGVGTTFTVRLPLVTEAPPVHD